MPKNNIQQADVFYGKQPGLMRVIVDQEMAAEIRKKANIRRNPWSYFDPSAIGNPC